MSQKIGHLRTDPGAITDMEYHSDPSVGLQWVRGVPCGITSVIFSQKLKIRHLHTDPGAMTEMSYQSDLLRGRTSKDVNR